jgi:hypothetical protein
MTAIPPRVRMMRAARPLGPFSCGQAVRIEPAGLPAGYLPYAVMRIARALRAHIVRSRSISAHGAGFARKVLAANIRESEGIGCHAR